MASNDVLLSNIVPDASLKRVQKETLQAIADVVSKTQGPAGSATMILHNDRFTEYSKDGHKVLKSIKFFRPLPQAIHDELLDITEYVVKKVGDGTTEATIMSNIVFNKLNDLLDSTELNSSMIMKYFDDIVDLLVEKIRNNGRPCELKDIRNICLISTNNNEKVTDEIVSIYEKFGLDVVIDLSTSNSDNSIIKTYDGISINKGYPTPAFINTHKATVEIRNPRIYYFSDPIDTPEQMSLFEKIFFTNIYEPYSKNALEDIVPTIILAPSISRDLQNTLNDIEKIFYAYDTAGKQGDKPPFCIVTGVNEKVDNINDIVLLCGCPTIRKYINPDVQKKDIEEGKAPSISTITEFYGSADLVEVGLDMTKIINPKEMFDPNADADENGNRPFSNVYNGLISNLEAELKLAKIDNTDINLIGNIKRRLNHLKNNFVEYLIGGIASADRDNVKDLAEDAILNCRSAVQNGVGYGAGFEGLRATSELLAKESEREARAKLNNLNLITYNLFVNLFYDAYYEYTYSLYLTTKQSTDYITKLIDDSLKLGRPFNIGGTNTPVLCSIETEPTILYAVSKIISVMFTANQALLVDPMQNTYIKDMENNE